jgi:hypothetical protein
MNMRIYPVVCFALLAIVTPGLTGKSGEKGDPGPPGPRYTYCPVDTKVNWFIRKLKINPKPLYPVGYNSQIKTFTKFNK